MVVVVIPSMVMETSLTMVLAEPPPPPEPELPPADCEDEVSDVEDVADVDDVAAVDDAAVDDVVAVDGDVVTAAVDEAIALIDMQTLPEGDSGAAPFGPLAFLLQRGTRRNQAPAPATNIWGRQAATNQLAASCRFFPTS